ncbi:MAG: hypothetical protein H7Y60_06430 [Rhodospirillaceae bacterium]|nr:hypothetical protein [Rhodospirillales bacterium]
MAPTQDLARDEMLAAVVRQVVEEEFPHELHLLERMWPTLLALPVEDSSDDVEESFFGEEISVVVPFLLDLVRDTVKDMVVAGLTLSAKELFDYVRRSRPHPAKKKGGRAKAEAALRRAAERRANR